MDIYKQKGRIMKNLSSLIKQYQDNPSLEKQQSISKFYIKNKENREQIQEQLLEFFRQDNLKGGIEWYSFFEGDKNFWNKVFLAVEEKNAEKFLQHVKEHQKKNNEVYLDFAVDMCDASASGVREIKNMPQEVEKVWINVFKEFPDFSEKIEQNKQQKQLRLEKYIKSLNLPVKEKHVTVQTLELSVPMMSMQGKKINFKDIENTQEYSDFMQERVEFFNNFHLEGYMKHPQCHNMNMKVQGHENIFTVQLNAEVNLVDLRKDLLGQLTDGLGSNLAQQPLLIKDKIYYFDFDTKNATEFSEVKTQLNNKRKI